MGEAIRLAQEEALYPVGKHEVASGTLAEAGARNRLAGAYALHRWAGSWIHAFEDDPARRRAEGRGEEPAR